MAKSILLLVLTALASHYHPLQSYSSSSSLFASAATAKNKHQRQRQRENEERRQQQNNNNRNSRKQQQQSGPDDLYKILGVKKNANDKEIKSAYRKLALKHHCDYVMSFVVVDDSLTMVHVRSGGEYYFINIATNGG
eukprot:scaffold7169_cov76-Cyclotella_meneghiniana.AAC.10